MDSEQTPQSAGAGEGGQAAPVTPAAQSPDLSKIVSVIEALAAQVGEIKQTQAELGEVTHTTRSKLQEKYDTLLTETNALRSLKERVEKSGLEKLPDGTSVIDVVAHKDSINAQLAADVAALQARVDDADRDKKRRDLEGLVFSNVAPAQRATAETLFAGIMNKDGIDIDKVQDLGALANQISGKLNIHLSAINGGPPTPHDRATTHEIQDPNKVNWDSYRTWADVPAALKPHVPTEVFARMEKPAAGSRGGGMRGFNI